MNNWLENSSEDENDGVIVVTKRASGLMQVIISEVVNGGQGRGWVSR